MKEINGILVGHVTKDLTGLQFGRLTVIKMTTEKTGSGGRKWECGCLCGNNIIVNSTCLVEGHSKSCGCLSIEMIKERATTHGKSKTPEYGAWKNAIRRCVDQNNKKYELYGGRGIRVCDRWMENWDKPSKEGFFNFLEDMGGCNGLTLDRVDVNKGYSIDNCRWVDTCIQGYNTRQLSTNNSGKTGVSWVPSRNKYQAYINFKKKRYNLGLYCTFEEAVEVREKAEVKYYGEKKGH